MRLTKLGLLASAAGAMFGVGSALVQAHHAFAMEFDVSHPVTLHGTVSKVELINPHSWIHIDVTNADGTHVTWMVEGGSPNALVRRGVNKSSIPLGSELIVTGYQARDGSNKAVGRNITFADGRELFFDGTRAPGEPVQ
jgi:Family of unknown function (DUF6152)